MHELLNKLAGSLLKKENIEACSVDELQLVVRQYPYFSSAQLLLAARTKQLNLFSEKEMTNVSVHVTNPFWLDLLFSENKPSVEKINFSLKPSDFPIVEDPINDELIIETKNLELIRPVLEEVQETVPSAPKLQVEKTEPIKTSMVFEPYHTVDYFASQGIRNLQDEKPKDQLGQQLKSFTEWLKAIRQLQPNEIAALSDSGSEEKVIVLASNSIEDRNVATESMAQVWIKQGKPEKAVEIYNKLSLLNPSKSGYFASLIENLKKI